MQLEAATSQSRAAAGSSAAREAPCRASWDRRTRPTGARSACRPAAASQARRRSRAARPRGSAVEPSSDGAGARYHRRRQHPARRAGAIARIPRRQAACSRPAAISRGRARAACPGLCSFAHGLALALALLLVFLGAALRVGLIGFALGGIEADEPDRIAEAIARHFEHEFAPPILPRRDDFSCISARP